MARCTALATALKTYGLVTVIIETDGNAWRNRFIEAGIETIAENDIADRFFAGIVLDDYDFKPSDVQFWRARTLGPIVQIDDLGVPLQNIDLLINATPGMTGETLGGVTALLGPAYAMLSAPYCRAVRPPIRNRVERIVVGFGLIDSIGATERVIRALVSNLASGCRVDVLLGSSSPHAKTVAALVRTQTNWSLHLDAPEPWRLVGAADLALSGGGQSLLERLALGIPTIGIAIAENQRSALTGAAAAGAAIDLGIMQAASEDRIAAAVLDLQNSPGRRASLSVAAQALVDGHGAERVASYLANMDSDASRRESASHEVTGR